MKWFTDHGYTPTDSQTNFIFVDIKRPARGFREACAKQSILVGRDFPPYEKTHCRISISTMEDMQKAVKVFEGALAVRQPRTRHARVRLRAFRPRGREARFVYGGLAFASRRTRPSPLLDSLARREAAVRRPCFLERAPTFEAQRRGDASLTGAKRRVHER